MITNKCLRHNFINLMQNFEIFKITLNNIFEEKTLESKTTSDSTFIQLLTSQYNN